MRWPQTWCGVGAAPTNGHKILNLLGGSEVSKLDEPCDVDQYIGALDVTVHDLVLVEILQPEYDLTRVNPHNRLLECPCSGFKA